MSVLPTRLRYFPAEDRERVEACETIARGEVVRGVGWVLKWAAAVAVLCVAAIILLNFAYRLAAEQSMIRAARAGIREASLPRATNRTVEQSIRRELVGCYRLGSDTDIALRTAGRPIKGIAANKSDGVFSVTLSASVNAALPNWLQALSPWHAQIVISAHTNQAG
jgi:hypothetical protein